MKTSKLIFAPIVSILALGGCDKQPDPAQKDACEAFAKHLAEVVQSEQGETVPQEQVDKMVESTVAKCLESPPKDAELKCAMAAQTSEAMKACE
jgi:PBP1b-binding outer membrane lipoprotein LpoB